MPGGRSPWPELQSNRPRRLTLRPGRLDSVRPVDNPEPPLADQPLLGLDSVLLTPHMGAGPHAAVENMSWVVRDVGDVVNQRRPTYPAP
jgi:hypothetical protein